MAVIIVIAVKNDKFNVPKAFRCKNMVQLKPDD